MLSLEELLNDDGIIAECSLIKDRRRITVCRRGFGCAHIGISPMPPMQNIGVYDDSWDFPSPGAALRALSAWKSEEAPKGWHRHMNSGRYRINGDEDLEYVKDDYRPNMSIEDHVIYAVKVTQGLDRVIKEVQEEPGPVGALFPGGTQCFCVISESADCTHDPRCRWLDRVYHHLDRCVVLSIPDFQWASIDNVIRRLTE